MDAHEILDDFINLYRNNTISIYDYMEGYEPGPGEATYLDQHKHNYILTLDDVEALRKKLGKSPEDMHVLEIGPFLGVVSLTLAKMGYKITLIEIEEYLSSKSVTALYDELGIQYHSVNLREYDLPFEDNTFDVILCCEVLEHLNFNPIPVLAEFNRVLAMGGFMYLAVPNLASLNHRLNLLRGGSIHYPVSAFFDHALKPGNPVGIHWREYNHSEARELLTGTGFTIEKQYLFDPIDTMDDETLKLRQKLRKRFLQWKPSWKRFLTTIGRKTQSLDFEFHLTGAKSAR